MVSFSHVALTPLSFRGKFEITDAMRTIPLSVKWFMRYTQY